MNAVAGALRTFALWEINALLALCYMAWERLPALLTLGAFLPLLRGVPASQAHQRPWITGVGALAILAGSAGAGANARDHDSAGSGCGACRAAG